MKNRARVGDDVQGRRPSDRMGHGGTQMPATRAAIARVSPLTTTVYTPYALG